MDVEFYKNISACVEITICVYLINQLRYKLHFWFFKILNQSCIPDINTWLWCTFWIWFPSILFKIFVSIFKNEIGLYIPFTFVKWVFSSILQSGFYYLHVAVLVTPNKLNSWPMSHRASWWLCQGWKSGLSEHKACLFPLSHIASVNIFSRLQNQLPHSWMFQKHKIEGRSMTRVIAASFERLC